MLPPPGPTPRVTPGMVRVRLTKLRPLRGRLSIVFPSTVTLRSDDEVWSSEVSAWISTVSVIAPRSSLRSTLILWSTPRWTLAIETFENPVISALTV